MFEGDEKLQESSLGQTNAEENLNKEECGETELTHEQIEGTMFTVVTNTKADLDKSSFISIGSNIATELMGKNEALEMIERRDWKLIEMMALSIARYVVQKEDDRKAKELEKIIEEQKNKGA